MRHLLSLALLCPILGATIVVRDDVPASRFVSLAEELDLPVGQVRFRDAQGLVVAEGTLIAPRWVLTAAHAVDDDPVSVEVRFDDGAHAVDEVFVHPGWSGVFEELHDIALLRLVEAASRSPVPVCRRPPGAGSIVTVVGRGMTGTGRTGPVEDDGVLRAATNRVTEVGDLHLSFVFDPPSSADATELEGISGPGDSGGPAFASEDGSPCLAGVSSAQDSGPTDGREGVYGVVEYYGLAPAFRDWIEAHVAGEARAEGG